MRALIFFLSIALSFGCVSPKECNAELCQDCACVDGSCSCADGWSGSACETPFCQSRANCSNHGSCRMELKQIYCVCDAGWEGPRCERPSCALNCSHGGVPSPDCSTCTNCLGAWGGKQCEIWNSSVPLSQLLDGLNACVKDAQVALSDLQAVNPIQGNIGWGVNIVTGTLASLPVVRLSYTDPQKSWHGFRYPVEAIVVPLENPQPICDSEAFSFVTDYVNYVHKYVAQSGGRNGIYGEPFGSVLSDFFNRLISVPDDPALSVTQLMYAIYKIQLPDSPQQPYVLDKFALRAIQALPPDYDSDTNKAIYRRFLEMFGSSYTTSSNVGGMVELRTLWAQWLTQAGFTSDALIQQAAIDFGIITGLCKQAQDANPTYSSNRINDPITCLGGDPAACSNLSNWLTTVATQPVPLTYVTNSISALVQDPAVKSSLEKAVSAWVQEQNDQWAATNLCPPRCGHGGNCSPPSQTCNECLPYAEGRSCLHCGSGFSKQNAGGHLLYRCISGRDHFTSTDPNCEGQRRENVLGGTSGAPGTNQLSRCYTKGDHMDEVNCGCPAPYFCEMNLGGLYPGPGDGLHGLYRCRSGSDHFDSTDPRCEGQVVEFLLGYLADACPSSGVSYNSTV